MIKYGGYYQSTLRLLVVLQGGDFQVPSENVVRLPQSHVIKRRLKAALKSFLHKSAQPLATQSSTCTITLLVDRLVTTWSLLVTIYYSKKTAPFST